MDRRAAMAKQHHRDSTDYSKSNTYSFRAHFTRLIAEAILTTVGAHIAAQAKLLSKGLFASKARGGAGSIERQTAGNTTTASAGEAIDCAEGEAGDV